MIVLHIGLKKSGSASIQSFLCANEDALRALSVDYPKIGRLGRKDHHNFASELRGRQNYDEKYGKIEDLVNHVRSSDFSTTIVSSEMFEGLRFDEIGALKNSLVKAGRPIIILLVLRDLVDLLQSSYAQKIKHGRNTYDFDSFFELRMREGRVDYFDTAKNWADVFGWENLRVRLLDSRHLVNGDLIEDFLVAAGVDTLNPTIHGLPRVGVVNSANGWKVLEAIRALYGDRHGLDRRHPLAAFIAGSRRKFDQKLMDRAAMEVGDQCGWGTDKGAYLTRAQAQEALDLYLASIAELNTRLSQTVPPPPDLDERNFVERTFMPDVSHIPPEELRGFYDQLGGWFARHEDDESTAAHHKRFSLNLRHETLIQSGATHQFSDVDVIAGEVLENRDLRLATIGLRSLRRGAAKPVLLIEAPDFFTRTDAREIAARVKDKAGLSALSVRFIPPRFLTKNSLKQVDRIMSAKHWLEHVEAMTAAQSAGDAAGPAVFRVVSVADGRIFRGLTTSVLETLARRLGTAVSFEQFSVPPTPVLLSDAVFVDHFARRLDDPEACRAVADIIQALRRADLIILDDGSELHFPLTQTYPVLSHRLKRSPDADLLAFRRYRYVAAHHKLPIVPVNGAGLLMDDRPAVIEAFSNYLDVPLFKVASSQALAAFTESWDYRPLQSETNGAALVPLAPEAFVEALGDWIERRVGEGAIRYERGEVAVTMVKPADPPFFASHPVDQQALERVLETFDRFCIAGHPSSVAFLPKYLDAVGKRYTYAPGYSARALERSPPFDCLLACGPTGPFEGREPAVAVMGAGWPTSVLNAPDSLAGMDFRGSMRSCRPGEWYSVLSRTSDEALEAGNGLETDDGAPSSAVSAASGDEDAEYGIEPMERDKGQQPSLDPRWQRLRAFPRLQIRETRKEIRGVQSNAWPPLQGCLVVLFTARSGSTFLTRELEFLYDIGRMGETLNPAQVKGRSVAGIIAHRRDKWFGFKAGLPGVVAGEFYGFFDVYLERTSFLRLVRRDIVGQAISFGKASQTGQWHAGNRPKRAPSYDAGKIAKAICKISAGIEQLRRYAEICERPCRTVFYEDFAEGDFASVIGACDALGIPRRPEDVLTEHRPVERMSDETNETWRSRFLEEIDDATREVVDRYLASFQE